MTGTCLITAERAGSRRSLRRLLGRTLLVGLFCFFAWCALAFVSSSSAAAAEHGASPGLLPGALQAVDDTTRAVGDTATSTLGVDARVQDTTRTGSRAATVDVSTARGHTATRPESATPADEVRRLLAPVRAGAVDINQPVMSAVGSVGGPIVSGARAAADELRPIAATLAHPVENALRDVAGKVRPVVAAPVLDGVVELTAGERSTAAAATSVTAPIALHGDGPRQLAGGTRVVGVDADEAPATELPPVGQSAPGTNSSPQTGGGAGQAGTNAHAEPISVLAASGPSAVIRPTDDDPCSDEQESPSVSPD